MKISIIVPAFNEEKILARSLASIKRACSTFDQRQWLWELVVCDNNSTDRTAEISRAAGAQVIFEPINQISRARNSGALAASGDWFIFVDADSFPSPELFARVADEISSGRCIGGGCLVKLDQRLPIANLLVMTWNFISRICRWAAGSFVFCDAKVFRQLGGFSQELFASEEVEFSQRLKKAARVAGKKVVIIHDVALLTSARKMHLYNRGEHVRFMVRAILRPRAVLASREKCHPWYDGRR
jgi:glycosyltransferase involved in cell wall biosynthesis